MAFCSASVFDFAAESSLALVAAAFALAVAVVAAVLNDKANRRAVVHLNGGDLSVEWGADDHVFLTGPAEEVFNGEIEA